MISRLTAFAALFAVVTTASLAFAATVAQSQPQRVAAASAPAEVIVLQRVEITGKRTVSN